MDWRSAKTRDVHQRPEDSRPETLVKAEPKKQADSTPASLQVKVGKETVSPWASALRTTAPFLPTYLPTLSLIEVTEGSFLFQEQNSAEKDRMTKSTHEIWP